MAVKNRTKTFSATHRAKTPPNVPTKNQLEMASEREKAKGKVPSKEEILLLDSCQKGNVALAKKVLERGISADTCDEVFSHFIVLFYRD